MLPDANYLSSRCQSQSPRAQNRGFCALLGSETLVSGHFEHKIGVFVLFWASKPTFSGISSTKSVFLCFFALRTPRFRAFEHKIEVFVLFWPSESSFSGISSTKSGFLCALVGRWPGATGATRATRATGATGATRATGATGTTAGIVLVADILSQGGFV